MGAKQGLVEFVGGLVILAMVFVLLEYPFGTIGRFCVGMGGFASSCFAFTSGAKQTAFFLMVIVMAIGAVLHAMGLSVGGALKKL